MSARERRMIGRSHPRQIPGLGMGDSGLNTNDSTRSGGVPVWRSAACAHSSVGSVRVVRRWRRIKRDNDDGDDDNGEKDYQKINSESAFRLPQSRKGTITYSTCILGVRLSYWHGEHVVTDLKRA